MGGDAWTLTRNSRRHAADTWTLRRSSRRLATNRWRHRRACTRLRTSTWCLCNIHTSKRSPLDQYPRIQKCISHITHHHLDCIPLFWISIRIAHRSQLGRKPICLNVVIPYLRRNWIPPIAWIISMEELCILFVVDVVDTHNVAVRVSVWQPCNILSIQQEGEHIIELTVDVFVILLTSKNILETNFGNICLSPSTTELELNPTRILNLIRYQLL